MPRRDVDKDCQAAREWFSAYRDGEALDEPARREHIEACARCSAWMATVDVVTPRLRVRRTGSPDVVSAALAEWDRQALQRGEPTGRFGRVLLGVAGATGLVFAVLGLLDVPGYFSRIGAHLGWELYSFEAALAFGFLLAARWPDRYGRALLPLVAAVAALTLLPAAADATAVRADPLAEASHVSVMVGLLGLLMLLDTRHRGRPAGKPADPARGGMPA